METPDVDLKRRFSELDPWFTRYDIRGEAYGGENSYDDDHRVPLFRSWCSQRRRILELGSFEGAHSLQLAADPAVDEVVGVEGRESNVSKARLVQEILGGSKVSFVRRDLEVANLSDLGRFDAIFCAGLLYHLSKPWELLEKLPPLAPRLFLDTHYTTEADVEVNGFHGKMIVENPDNPVDGLITSTFRPVFPDLVLMLLQVGYAIRAIQDHPTWDYGPRVHLFCDSAG